MTVSAAGVITLGDGTGDESLANHTQYTMLFWQKEATQVYPYPVWKETQNLGHDTCSNKYEIFWLCKLLTGYTAVEKWEGKRSNTTRWTICWTFEKWLRTANANFTYLLMPTIFADKIKLLISAYAVMSENSLQKLYFTNFRQHYSHMLACIITV